MVARDPKERVIRLTFARALAAVSLIGFGAAVAGIGVRASYGARVTGDEPQYLLTAISLYEDRSLDVSDEIAESAYEPFHEVTLDRQTEPLEGGREVSPHDPLLPLLLALPVAVAGWAGAKVALAACAGAVAALILAIAHRRLGAPLVPATAFTALFAASAPLAVYGNQVYPEIVAALFVAVAMWILLAPPTRRSWLWVALAVSALVWLSVKYAPVGAAVATLGIIREWRAGRRKEAGAALAFYGVAAAVFALAHLEWYGGLTPYATGDHFVSTGQFGVVGTGVDLWGRSARLIGLLIDRNFGLVAWQPLFLAAIPAAAVALRRRAHGRLLVVAGAGWLTATFVALTMHGWWWPGRQVIVVLPALIPVVVAWLSTSGTAVRRAGYLAGGWGVLTLIWFVVEGYLGRVTWVVDFFETSNPLHRALRPVLPDYMVPTGGTWVRHALWLCVAAVALWLAVARNSRRDYSVTETSIAMPSAR